MHQARGQEGGEQQGQGECLLQPVLVTGAFDLFPAASLFSSPGRVQVTNQASLLRPSLPH